MGKSFSKVSKRGASQQTTINKPVVLTKKPIEISQRDKAILDLKIQRDKLQRAYKNVMLLLCIF